MSWITTQPAKPARRCLRCKRFLAASFVGDYCARCEANRAVPPTVEAPEPIATAVLASAPPPAPAPADSVVIPRPSELHPDRPEPIPAPATRAVPVARQRTGVLRFIGKGTSEPDVERVRLGAARDEAREPVGIPSFLIAAIFIGLAVGTVVALVLSQ